MQMVPRVSADRLEQQWTVWSAAVPEYWKVFKFTSFSDAELTFVKKQFSDAPARVNSSAKTATLRAILQTAVGEDNLAVLLQRIGYDTHGNLGDKRSVFEKQRRNAIVALLDFSALGTCFPRVGFQCYFFTQASPNQLHFFQSQPSLVSRACSNSVKRGRRPRPRISGLQPRRFFQTPPPRNSQPQRPLNRQPHRPLNRPPPKRQLIASSSQTTSATRS